MNCRFSAGWWPNTSPTSSTLHKLIHLDSLCPSLWSVFGRQRKLIVCGLSYQPCCQFDFHLPCTLTEPVRECAMSQTTHTLQVYAVAYEQARSAAKECFHAQHVPFSLFLLFPTQSLLLALS